MNTPHVVALGGDTGLSSLLRGLKHRDAGKPTEVRGS